MMLSPAMPVFASVSVYIFLRGITKYGKGTVRLHGKLRKLLLPFSEHDTVASFFVPTALCCYFVMALFLARCIFPMGQYISVKEFNVLCVSLFLAAFSVPMSVVCVKNIMAANRAEKVLNAVSLLTFLFFAVIGAANSGHIIFKLIQELLLR